MKSPHKIPDKFVLGIKPDDFLKSKFSQILQFLQMIFPETSPE